MQKNSEKMDPLFYLANSLSPEEQSAADELMAGYDRQTKRWELIVKYQGNIKQYEDWDLRVEELINGYAVAIVTAEGGERLASLREVEYIEKPRPIYEQAVLGQRSSCITTVKRGAAGLEGKGVLVAVLDSGIDVESPFFRDESGRSRIRGLWDQNGEEGGTEYSEEEINEYLSSGIPFPVQDISGHGTAVTGILAASRGQDYEGVASACSLLVVKLRKSGGDVFSQSVDILRGVTYALRKAWEWDMPLVINLSYGTVWGSHKGDSLMERFINNAAEIGRTSIVVGCGNEGVGRSHAEVILRSGEISLVELEVGEYDFDFSLHFFYPGNESFEITLLSPLGEEIHFPAQEGVYERILETIRLDVTVSFPKPYTTYQEVFVRVTSAGDFLPGGIWYIRIRAVDVLTGEMQIYISSALARTGNTGFVIPTADMTLTIPSTAERVISVGAYSAYTNSYAAFSGRGMKGIGIQSFGLLKPDLVAPGVNIRIILPGGGFSTAEGTSFSTPFVSGSVALLMEWGIVRGNDAYLYGEKVKAVLRRGARRLAGFDVLPNEREGWGALCLQNSLGSD